jgi:hypothetical protein
MQCSLVFLVEGGLREDKAFGSGEESDEKWSMERR